MKYCKNCDTTKPATEFSKNKLAKDGLQTRCKCCNKQENRKYYIDNAEHIKQETRKYYIDNAERIKQENRKYYIDNAEGIKQAKKKYYIDNAERIKQENITYTKNRRKTDPLFKLKSNIRRSICRCIRLKGSIKNSRTAEILGCDFYFFRDYLEAQFAYGMTWENQGSVWHLDHIIPISSALTEERIIELNHFSNFQPLFAEDNLEKSNKLDWVKCPVKYALQG